MATTLEKLGETTVKHEEQIKTVFKQLDTLTEKMDAIEGLTLSVHKLSMSVEQLAKNQSEDRDEQKRLTEKIITLENNPDKDKASKYDKIADKISTVVIGAIIGYLLRSLFGI